MKNLQNKNEVYRTARAKYLEHISQRDVSIPIEIYEHQRRRLHNEAFEALKILNQEWITIYKRPLISKDEFSKRGADLVTTFKGAPRRK